MANDIPQPRGYQQILGEMIDSVLSRTGFLGLRIGGPVLSILEAAAQANVRSTQDIFGMLEAVDLDRATASALDRIGTSEKVIRKSASQATGYITITDTSFDKVSSTIYTGTTPPNAGVSTIAVADASLFPTTGQIYLGRGTTNLEGPIVYNSIAQVGSYFVITLDSATTKFHNPGESVILAQGGNRALQSGLTIKTATGNVSESVSFNTTATKVLLDGEIAATEITVICEKPGVIGNVGVGSITAFATVPFAGAKVTNVVPFTNGRSAESDSDYRDRIREARRSRSKGIALAIKNSILDVQATDESARVVSTSVVAREGSETVVYIDNGLGYEQSDSGIAIDVLVDSALGGEEAFQLGAERPISKAFVRSGITAPFALRSGDTLSVKVGGVLFEHTFSNEDFRAIAYATAYEVVASINSNYALGWIARTAEAGTRVVVYSKSDVNEDVEVVVPSALDVTDANDIFDFPTNRVDTVKLYKNDKLLYKDGLKAVLGSAPKHEWSNQIATGETLRLNVDGTGFVTYTFTDVDFSGSTAFLSVSKDNSIAAWVTVVNNKIPGVTASGVGNQLFLVSNKGLSSSASLEIDASLSSLVTKGVFTSAYGLESVGKTNDYTFNRNLGQLKLNEPLIAGERLTVGTASSRAYVNSTALANASVTLAAPAKLWFVVDGAAEVIPTNVGVATSLTVSLVNQWYDGGNTLSVRYTGPSATTFAGVQKGDWCIVWDPEFTTLGVWRVTFVYAQGLYIQVQRDASGEFLPETKTVTSAGMIFVRTTARLHELLVPAGTYTIDQLVDYIQSEATVGVDGYLADSRLTGCYAGPYLNDRLRVTTNTAGGNGDICLVAADTEGKKLLLALGELESNESTHFASVESVTALADVPTFRHSDVATADPTTAFDSTLTFSQMDYNSGRALAWIRPWEKVGAAIYRVGNNKGVSTLIETSSGTTDIVIRPNAFSQPVLFQNRFYPAYALDLVPEDKLSVVIDNDPSVYNYLIPMGRNVKPAGGSTYGNSFAIVDVDNSNQKLSDMFGTDYDFRDFAVFMHARAVSHPLDVNKAILWRYARVGPDGNGIRLMYLNPTEPDADMAASVVLDEGNYVPILGVKLPSGSARGQLGLTNTTRLTVQKCKVLKYKLQAVEFQAGEEVTANPNGVGTVVEVYDSGATGYLILKDVTGVFDDNEGLVGGMGGSATTDGGATISYTQPNGAVAYWGLYEYIQHIVAIGGVVRTNGQTVTVTLANHGYTVGDTVWCGGDSQIAPAPSFGSGVKLITQATPNTFTYVEPGLDGASVGQITYDSASSAPTFNLEVAAGDIVSIHGTSLGAVYNEGEFRVTSRTATGFVVLADVDPVQIPKPINAASNIKFYPIAANTAANVVVFVNDPANALEDIVTATLVGTGATSVNVSTIDEWITNTPNSGEYWPFSDGINWVKESNLAAIPNTIDLKENVTAALDIDFENEALVLVPNHFETLVRWISSPAVSGLYSSADIGLSSQAQKLQLASRTAGTDGCVQVTGGTANAVGVAVAGTARSVGGIAGVGVCLVAKSEAVGILGDGVCLFEAVNTVSKGIVFGALEQMSVTESATNVFDVTTLTQPWIEQVGGPPAWNCPNGVKWVVERHGRFVCYTVAPDPVLPPVLPDVSVGSYLYIIKSSGVSLSNTGIFRVVYSDNVDSIWVENDNAVEEEFIFVAATDTFTFLTPDSVVPGDYLVIPDNTLGASNRGTWKVLDIDLGDPNTIQVSGAMVESVATVLGTSASLFRVDEGEAAKVYKKVKWIYEYASDPDYYEIVVVGGDGSDLISANRGSLMKPANKLQFPTKLERGVDGYAHTVGLIGEVAKILYGDERDPDTYPGVVAAGSGVSIQGPVIKRIRVSLAVRVTGDSTTIINDVQSAVAATINQTGIGQPVAISDLVAAANSVVGVLAVSVVSPVYGVGNDLIPVQPYEKPIVLDVESDISVKIVGA